MASALITGIGGFTGKHLAQHLLDQGEQVAGVDCATACLPSMLVKTVTSFTGDICDQELLKHALLKTHPDTIYHLAGILRSDNVENFYQVNVLGTLALFQTIAKLGINPRVIVTSSSAVYGSVPPGILPITEEHPFRPASAYAVSKIAQEMVAYQQFVEHDLRIIRTRAFNLTGPGESATFVTSAFARQIAEIEAGLREPIVKVGNLETMRDFCDVRDAIRAYCLLTEHGKPGEVYNICSGQGISIHQLLNLLLDLSTVRGISVQVDSSRLQAADVPIQVGDSSRLRAITGWAPQIPLRQTLEDVLYSWRHYISPGEHLNEMAR